MSIQARLASRLSPQMRGRIKSTLRHLGIESGINYTSVRHLRALISELGITMVIDVGANNGQFGRFMREEVGYHGRIVSFEPVGQSFARLLQTATGDREWKCYRKAVGSANERLTINVSDSSVFDSFRDLAEDTLLALPNKRKEEVEVVRLDDFLKDLQGNVFLKVDTQGFDMEVIDGAAGIMSRVQALQTEIPFIHLYKDTVPFEQVISKLGDMGFAISALTPISMRGLQAIECDCLMVRKISHGNTISYPNMLNWAPRL